MYFFFKRELMEKSWKLKALTNLETSQNLQKEIKVPKVISDLLILRGVSSFSDAKNFFRPDLNQLHDPFFDPHVIEERILSGGDNVHDCISNSDDVKAAHKFLSSYMQRSRIKQAAHLGFLATQI